MTPQISLGTLIPKEKQKLHIRILIKVVDKIMGLAAMQKIYTQHRMQGLSKEEFADKLLETFNVKIEGEQELLVLMSGSIA